MQCYIMEVYAYRYSTSSAHFAYSSADLQVSLLLASKETATRALARFMEMSQSSGFQTVVRIPLAVRQAGA